ARLRVIAVRCSRTPNEATGVAHCLQFWDSKRGHMSRADSSVFSSASSHGVLQRQNNREERPISPERLCHQLPVRPLRKIVNEDTNSRVAAEHRGHTRRSQIKFRTTMEEDQQLSRSMPPAEDVLESFFPGILAHAQDSRPPSPYLSLEETIQTIQNAEGGVGVPRAATRPRAQTAARPTLFDEVANRYDAALQRRRDEALPPTLATDSAAPVRSSVPPSRRPLRRRIVNK
ncbi:hypothetical protein GGX14DRAFT_468218, partial [Mycena pura]